MDENKIYESLSSPEYALIFRYKSGSSYITPDSRVYVFEIYKPKGPQKSYIFKESRPGSWEGEPNFEEFIKYHSEYYKKVLLWRKDIKFGKIIQPEKLLTMIRELPPPNYLQDEIVLDGNIFSLKVNLSDIKAEYNWMKLVKGIDFEQKVKNIITFSKSNML